MGLFGGIVRGLTDVATFGTAEIGGVSSSLGKAAESAVKGNLIDNITGVTSARDANAANAANAAAANAFSAEQAQKQMDFQERMRSSAHQREVADLRAAGLNPLLSVNAGASSPNGAMGTANVPDVMPVPSALQSGLSTALEVGKAYSSIKSGLAAADASKAFADKARIDADLSRQKGPEAEVSNSFWSMLNEMINGLKGYSAKQLFTGDGSKARRGNPNKWGNDMKADWVK